MSIKTKQIKKMGYTQNEKKTRLVSRHSLLPRNLDLSRGKSVENTKKLSKYKLFIELANLDDNYKSKVILTDKFIGKWLPLKHSNGASWHRRDSTLCKLYKISTMSANGKISIKWNFTDDEKKDVYKCFSKFKILKGSYIKYIKVFGKNNTSTLGRPICRNIRIDLLKNGSTCVFCGSSSNLIIDHKNDLYNNPRVLCTKTQKKSDFQVLCNGCNLRKRENSNKSKKECKRKGVSNIPFLKSLSKYNEFIGGNENLDIKNVNAMKGTFWYDPKLFIERTIEKIIIKTRLEQVFLELKNSKHF